MAVGVWAVGVWAVGVLAVGVWAVKVYAGMDPRMAVGDVLTHARRVEALGYDGLHVAETVHDALALALLVADHTARMTIRTSVALAFTRSPTLTAYAAWDCAKHARGRFELGLGTQIRQNIEGRYGMPFGDPVERLRDYLGALDALFTSFTTGGSIDYDSPHYRLTRLQPYFNPGPDPETQPPAIYLGGVNAGMCRLAGARADGFVTHPTNSNPRYLETLCRPQLAAGAESAGRTLADLELVVGTQVITGRDRPALDRERERQRRLFAFLYSTPAYRRTLELYGWEDLAGRLQDLIRHDRWDDLAAVVDDEVLDTLIPTATWDELPALLAARFGHLGQGVLVAAPTDGSNDAEFAEVVAAIRRAGPASNAPDRADHPRT